ncbi:antitoxin [Collinsella sp. WCA1-178-WT-3 (M2)]|nr:antitoxin [Collinsella sp. WCA1-178-WT-3 (M2)]MSS52118.1 antitoxin [Collinsella sp. WCA1-178-WT-3 (M1)]
MMALTGSDMAMCEIKFDEGERALIQDRADAAGMSFSEFVRRAALEKAEEMADIEAYNEALDGDDGIQYPMEEVVRMAAEAE